MHAMKETKPFSRKKSNIEDYTNPNPHPPSPHSHKYENSYTCGFKQTRMFKHVHTHMYTHMLAHTYANTHRHKQLIVDPGIFIPEVENVKIQ